MTFDGHLKQLEWQGALKIHGTFVLPGTSHYPGEYPFELSVLGDEKRLYLGMVVRGLDPVIYQEGASTIHAAEHVSFLFAPIEGALVPPADGIDVSHLWESGAGASDLYWNGEAWAAQDFSDRSSFEDGEPIGGRWAKGTRTIDDEHGIVWEVFASRTTQMDINKFHFPKPGAFRMGLFFFRQHPDHTLGIGEDGDTFPGDGPTRTEGDPSLWIPLKFEY